MSAIEPVAAPEADEHRPAPSPARLVKRSIAIEGHRTSVALEAAFWDALDEIARRDYPSLSSLIAQADRMRGDQGLASALRLLALDYYRRKAGAE
ncbi:MAG TPA: aryl-sulfate sulfotransferase [Hyphomonadaceae bacterium]|nr:aryl-sulfate sulfotransferase [Hyphomonadaceae bacterium]